MKSYTLLFPYAETGEYAVHHFLGDAPAVHLAERRGGELQVYAGDVGGGARREGRGKLGLNTVKRMKIQITHWIKYFKSLIK